MIRSTLGLFALLFMLSSTAWSASANENYQVDKDVQSPPYAPLDGGAAEEGLLWDFAGAWRLAAAEGGVVTLEQDVLVAAEDAPEGIFVQVPEDGQVLLDLNGHRLVGEDVPCLIYVGARGRLTVTDGGQSGGQIVGVIGVDDGADDPGEWGQVELRGDVEVVDPNVMTLAELEAEYMNEGNTQSGTFKDMWNLAAANGGTVTLRQNVTAVSGSFGTGDGFGNGAIKIPQDVEITLDLNGKILDRGLTAEANNGHVIEVNGSLTIKDSSTDGTGTITGGYTKGCGGGVLVQESASLNMYAGNITGNRAYDGGGVYISLNGKFDLYNGKISQNQAYENGLEGSGGGIYLSSNATLNFYDGEISDNTSRNTGGGIHNDGYGQVTMSGGSIVRNTTTGSYGHGGGIATYSSITITGGLIKDNTAKGYSSFGGGVFLASVGGRNLEYAISGNPQIIDNKVQNAVDNVHIIDSPKITVGALTAGARVGISTRASNFSDSVSEFQISNSDQNGEKYLKYFFADDSDNCYVAWDETGKYIKLVAGSAPHEHALNVGCDESITAGADPITFEKKLSSDGGSQLCVDGTAVSGNTL